MSRRRQSVFCLAAAALVFSSRAPSPAAPLPDGHFPATTNLFPPMPQLQSPVVFFRQLLAMSPAERLHTLTNRPPQIRASILAKVREYQALEPDERELRLRATELRWYLTPLLQLPPADREARLAQVPDELRNLIKTRLVQWDILPPPMQQEFLANDQALHYFAHVETTNNAAAGGEQPGISEQFNQFFELTPAEKKQTLNTLSDAERARMEKTLQTFDQLPPQQRILCVRNYAKFAGMSGAERADFLKNAERWSQMSPQERQAWRDLVENVPIWPPMPAPAVPPGLIPHAAPRFLRPSVATNLN